MARWRLVKQLGITLLDITAKTGIRAFAPTMEHVMEYKKGNTTEEEYTRIYNARMKKSQTLFPDEWDKLSNHSNVALACYCSANCYCHRHLFKHIMKSYLEERGYEVNLKEEITNTLIKPKQLGTDIVLRMKDGQLVQHYLLASYCYYMMDQSPMTDEAYDLVCKLLTERWDRIEHQHKQYIEFLDGKVGSGFAAVHKYPLMVRVAAEHYTDRIASGELLTSIEAGLNPLDHIPE